MTVKTDIIIGLDPGYADTGWGVIEKSGDKLKFLGCGSVKTRAGLPWPSRLLHLWQEMESIITTYQPTKAGIELLFFNHNQTTAMKVAEARGLLLTQCALRGLTPVELTPQQIKLTLTGNGRADKKQIGRMIMMLLQLPTLPQPDDATDALACAISAGLYHRD